MTTRILVNPANPMGAATLEVVHSIYAMQDAINRLKVAVDAMNYGSDDASVASELGINIAQVPDLMSLLASATTAANASILTEFASRLDQG